jgi:hypothetical protein
MLCQQAHQSIGLNVPDFDLLVYGLHSRRLLSDRPAISSEWGIQPRWLEIVSAGKALLVKVLAHNPRLLEEKK